MLRTLPFFYKKNSLINYCNNLKLGLKFKNCVVHSYTLNNAKLNIALPTKKHYDKLNNIVTGYKFSKTYPSLLKWWKNFFYIQWARINFRGKSYRVRNFCKNNKFTFNFGYSHWTKLKLFANWFFFKKRRQNFLIFTYSLTDFMFFKRFFPYIRFYNCYTKRGLRLKKQPIIRRFGKISQHISSLH